MTVGSAIMGDRVFIDTNVLIYAYDRSENEKYLQARRVLHELVANGTGVISTQVLGEFFVNITQKVRAPLTIAEATDRVEAFIQSFEVIDVSAFAVLDALRAVTHYQLSYWDALIWASARLNRVSVIFTEDFRSSAILEGVHVINPFAPGFNLAEWA